MRFILVMLNAFCFYNPSLAGSTDLGHKIGQMVMVGFKAIVILKAMGNLNSWLISYNLMQKKVGVYYLLRAIMNDEK